MLSTLVALSMMLLPWAVGALSLYGLFRHKIKGSIASVCIVLGAGSYVGPISLAFGMTQALKMGFNPFTTWMLLPAGLLILAAWLLGGWRASVSRHDQMTELQNPPNDISRVAMTINAVLASTVCLIALWLLWEVGHNPLLAWDAVWRWGVDANQQITLARNETPAFVGNGTHPATVVQILAWGAFWASVIPSGSMMLSPWAFLYLGWVLVTLGVAYRLSGHWTLACIATLIVSSAPMIESHVALGGYADLWLASGLVFGLALVLGLDEKRELSTALVVGVVIIASSMWIKNNGILYVLIVLLALIFGAFLTGPRRALGWGAVGGLAAVLAWMLAFGIDLDLGILRLVYLPDEGLVGLNNRVGSLSEAGGLDILQNLWQAWWVSSSYGLGFSLMLVLLPLGLCVGLVRRDFVGVALTLGAIGFVVFFVLAQFVSAYFYEFATPETDTGLTRFSHALLWLVVMAGVAATGYAWRGRRQQAI